MVTTNTQYDVLKPKPTIMSIPMPTDLETVEDPILVDAICEAVRQYGQIVGVRFERIDVTPSAVILVLKDGERFTYCYLVDGGGNLQVFRHPDEAYDELELELDEEA